MTCGTGTSTARWLAPLAARSPPAPSAPATRWYFWPCCCWPGCWCCCSSIGLSQRLGAASLLLVGLYPLAKRVTWWPQLMMGFTFGAGAPMGYAAATGRIDAAWVALYVAAILWDLGFDTIYAHQDREDDALVGVHSTARLFGSRTRPFLAACYAAAIVALALAGWLAAPRGMVLPGSGPAGGPPGATGDPPGH